MSAASAGRTVSRPAVVLVGPSGAGKTTIGGLLAERLGVEFRDTDADIVQRAGKPISEIFVDDGEPAFRALERAAVAAALAEHPGVLALGGGAVLAAESQELLRGLNDKMSRPPLHQTMASKPKKAVPTVTAAASNGT